jgi:ABC-type polar amino acid transport system ATPase subunit
MPSAVPALALQRPMPDALCLASVEKRFGPRQILDSITLALPKHQILALCGPSGSGKTTLLRIISGLIPFDAGQLTIGGVTVRAGAPYPAELYGRIGLIFQDHNLFPHLTALGNVTLALREFKRLAVREAHERAMAELERMGVAALAQQYPATLSGGERQRVAIARALALDPFLLLLDEPTAQLDPDRMLDVRDRVLQLANAGMTMLLVTHNVALARQAATIFALMQNGSFKVSNSSAILNALEAQKS